MKIIYERIRDLPRLVKALTFSHNGWIVGGGARYLLGMTDNVRDWDVLIPLENWHGASLIIPYKSVSNTFGGFKVIEDDIEIDIWGDSISNFLLCANNRENVLVQPRHYFILSESNGLIYD